MALCDTSDMEAVLGATAGSLDSKRAAWAIAKAQGLVETFCDRLLELDSGIVETIDGPGPFAKDVFVKQYPISSVTSITENGTALTADEFRIYADEGRIERRSGDYAISWNAPHQGIVITYDGGYTTIPADIVFVAAQIAARIYAAGVEYQASSGVKSERLGDYAVDYGGIVGAGALAAAQITQDERKVLSRYRTLGFG